MTATTHLPQRHRNAPWKIPCRAATTATITIATALNNADVLDGVTLATGDRVLVKDQATPSQNGIYVVGASPALAVDFATGDEAFGAVVVVTEGTVNADTMWLCTANAPITIGSTALPFVAMGKGFVPVLGYAECNTSPVTDATPNQPTLIPFDTFYDSTVSTIADLSTLGLTVSTSFGGTEFTADERGIWVVSLGVDLIASPGSVGRIYLNVPDFGYNPRYDVLAAGNPGRWLFERTLILAIGDSFSLRELSAGSSVGQINGYASLNILRTANDFA